MTEGHRRCPKCGEVKPLDGGFYRVTGKKARKDGSSSWCCDCVRAYSRAWCSEARTTPEGRLRSLVARARFRARRDGIPCTIEWTDLSMPDSCPCCGNAFDLAAKNGKGSFGRHSPTLDRLVPSLGYAPGNVLVVCYDCNVKRRDSTCADLFRIGDFYWKAAANLPPEHRLEVWGKEEPCDSQSSPA